MAQKSKDWSIERKAFIVREHFNRHMSAKSLHEKYGVTGAELSRWKRDVLNNAEVALGAKSETRKLSKVLKVRDQKIAGMEDMLHCLAERYLLNVKEQVDSAAGSNGKRDAYLGAIAFLKESTLINNEWSLEVLGVSKATYYRWKKNEKRTPLCDRVPP